MITAFLGFCPDFDPSMPGVMTACSGIMPTVKGFKPTPSPQQLYVALPSACIGEAFWALYLNGTQRFFAGTATQLYEGVNGTWTPVGSGSYGGGKWRFAMYGNDCIATNGIDAPQVAGTSGSFSALGGSPPIAPLVETLYGFTFLFESDNWHCSGIGTDNVWSNSVADQSATGPLIDTPGSITAARKLGRSIVVNKQNGVYRGDFVDVPLIWDFSLVAPVPGARSQGCVVDIGMQHAFIGTDDFYLTDGQAVWSIPGINGAPNPVKEWFFSNLDGTNAANIEGAFDQSTETVRWHFPSINANPAGSLDMVVMWNYRTNKWTADNYPIEAIIRPSIAAYTSWTYQQFDTAYGTYNGIPNLPYNSQLFFGSNQGYNGFIDTNHVANAFSGPPGSSTITTGDYGDDVHNWFLDGIRPVMSLYPSLPENPATATEFWRERLGDKLTQSDTEQLSGSKFPLRQSAAFHRWQFNFTGAYEIIGIDPNLIEDGDL